MLKRTDLSVVVFACRNPSYQTGGGWNRGRQLKKKPKTQLFQPCFTTPPFMGSPGSLPAAFLNMTSAHHWAKLNQPRSHPGQRVQTPHRKPSWSEATVLAALHDVVPHSQWMDQNLTFVYKQAQHQKSDTCILRMKNSHVFLLLLLFLLIVKTTWQVYFQASQKLFFILLKRRCFEKGL